MKRTLNRMTKITPNKYFQKNTSKDVWTLTNEFAASAVGKSEGRELINLGQGFFSYSPPQFAINAAKSALDVPLVNQYSPTRGRPSLIKSLVELYKPVFGDFIDNQNVLVTTGANEGILSCLMGILNAGDEVIVFEPFFDQYIPNIELCGGVVRYVPIHPPKEMKTRNTTGDEWQIDWDALEKTFNNKTKAVIINTPHNPIGKVFTEQELTKLAQLCVEHNTVVISDEVYEHLYFTESFPRIANINEDIANLTLTVGSAGKSFAATGWRIGWIISKNDQLLNYVSKAHTRICFASPSPLQEACAGSIDHALKIDYFPKMREEYRKKFEILTTAFDKLGLNYTQPEGTYFILVDFSKVKIPEDYVYPEELLEKAKDFRISYWLINEIGIVAIPPTEFYIKEHEKDAETLLRFAVCKEDEYLAKAAERFQLLKDYL
ncbi:putative kynurenine--oxoglutarate transaminase BNA3 [Nakaseomyces glabratus]|nr:putative kynurenine--oxoglutarate transaminase BNA3 [Nakaseomyces glabratus]KTB17183.1 putative kynurenine--oxoglutarate transaminase BNA3 [Nakaseomyces glabratus]